MPVSVPLETMGGLVCAARPEDLPEGASPRNYDIDYMIGRWYQRPGTRSVYAYADESSGPNSGNSAVSVSGPGNPWLNPANILMDDGNYALGSQTTGGAAVPTLGTGTSSGSGAAWANPQNATSPTSLTSSALTAGGSPPVVSPSLPVTINAEADSGSTFGSAEQIFDFFGTGTVTQFTVNYQAEVAVDGVSMATVILDYSTDNGATWIFIDEENFSFGPASFVISGSFPTSSLLIRVRAQAQWIDSDPVTVEVDVNSISVVGSSGPGVLNTQTLTVPVTYIGPATNTVTLTFQGFYTGAPATIVVNGQAVALTSSNAGYSLSLPVIPTSITITGAASGTSVLSLNNLAITATTITAGINPLDVTQFAFDLPSTVSVTGVQLVLKGYATTATTVTVQLLLNGATFGTAKTVALPTGPGTLTLGGMQDLWGGSIPFNSVNNTTFGVRITAASAFPLATALLGYVSLEVFQTAENGNFNFLTTFVANDGTVRNLAFDANGNLWVENVSTNPGVLTLVMESLTPNSYASSTTADDGEFIAFNDLTTGSDLPRKYLPEYQDRVSQVGPGAPPVFRASSASAVQYPIVSITQPAALDWGFAFGLQSTGPGSGTAGNVVTVYYADSTTTSGDPALIAAFNSGQPVLLYCQFTPSSGGDTVGALTTPITVQVTSVGLGKPNGQSRLFYYFTFTAPNIANVWNPGQNGFGVQYQQTLATLTTSVPVPQLTVGSNAVVTGATPSPWNSTWPITQTLNSGAMAITQTALSAAGVATYSYTVASGANPVPGQLVTVTGTLNGNGALNVVNTPIATVSGTNIGTFTINLLPGGTDFPAEPEEGQATTAGTEFTFEPGLLTLGSGTSPIYGTGSGGDITVTGSGQFIGPGTKQGVYGWITRNGYLSPPSPPCTFDVPENTTAILGSSLGIGPPNVIGRYVSFTESGANGVPGANFFMIPIPEIYIVENVSYTATSTWINDNTSTTASFSFPDATLLKATAIDVQGNDLFNLIEIGNPAWVVSYASRNFYGLCQNKLQNFLNLSFDGGYLPSGQLTPLGWTQPDVYGQLLVSPIFGNSFYIKNTSGGTLATGGLISQAAFQDAYLVPIIQPNVAYSVRVCARIPSGNTNGNLVVDLAANGIQQGSFTLPFYDMTPTFAIYTGTLLLNEFATVPSALLLRAYAQNIADGADVEIDRIEIFPTLQPVLQTDVAASYANNRESVDDNSAYLDTSETNSQPCYGGAVVLDQLFLLKERSMQGTQDSPNFEPGASPGWGLHEISQEVGTCGVNAFDYGDEWLLTMCRSGVYGFNGGRPEPCSRELQIQNGPQAGKGGLWESINWAAAQSFWLRNDINSRRFYCGVALPTPNFWLPNAPVNANPTQPNVILMCNYEGCPTFDELISGAPVHTTIMGQLKALEQKRKWSIWQIPSPYAAMVKQSTGEQLTLLLCNGIASGKIYELVPQQGNDDGVPFFPLYTTYGFVGTTQGQALQLGAGRKLASWWTGNVQGKGLGGLRFYPNTLGATYPQTNPLALRLQNPAQDDDERKIEVSAQRIFVEITGQGDGQGGGYIECGSMTLEMAPHPWNAKRGISLGK